MPILSVVRLQNGDREMRQLTKNEKTRLRVALAILHHLGRFRLVKVDEGELDLDRVLETVSDLLDAFEERLPDMRRSAAKAAPSGAENPSGLSSKQKPTFSFRANKGGTISLP